MEKNWMQSIFYLNVENEHIIKICSQQRKTLNTGAGLKISVNPKRFKTSKFIKRNYYISNYNFMEQDPFSGSSINYIVEEPGETVLHKIAKLPIALIRPDLINQAITGNNNVNFFGNLALRTVPIASSLIIKTLGLPFGNTLMLMQSIFVRILARRLTGNSQYGALDLIQDTYRIIQLCKTVNTNVKATYYWGQSWYNWAAGWGTYFKGFIYTTKTVLPRESANQLALTASNVDGYKQVIYKNNPYHLTEENYEVFSQYKDILSDERKEILLKTLNHQDTFTDNLARQYLNMTTVKTQLPLQQQISLTAPKINNEIASHTVEYFPKRLNVTNKEDAINIAEKIKETQINIKQVSQQPDILLQPDEQIQEMTLLGKIIAGMAFFLFMFMCYKTYKDHAEWFSATYFDTKVKLNKLLFGRNESKIIEVDKNNNPIVINNELNNLYPNLEKKDSGLLSRIYNKIIYNEYFGAKRPTAPDISDDLNRDCIESLSESADDINNNVNIEDIAKNLNIKPEVVVENKDNIINVSDVFNL